MERGRLLGSLQQSKLVEGPVEQRRIAHQAGLDRFFAHLIVNESWWSTRTVASKVTEMVLDRLIEDDLGSHRWKAFTWDDADQMRCAIAAKLVKCSPTEGLLVRENPTGVFRKVEDVQWLPIPGPIGGQRAPRKTV